MPGKKTQGRRKIEMKPIQTESDRMVTFSKRRNGLFKKASELATLCGVEMAIIAFSVAGKSFSFGSPNVESVLDRFSKKNAQQPDDCIAKHVKTRREARVKDLNRELDEINEKLAAEKKRGQRLKPRSDSFNSYVDSLDINGLKHLMSKLEMLQEKVKPRVADMNIVEASSSEPCKELVLFKGEKNEGGEAASPIPPDWLKL